MRRQSCELGRPSINDIFLSNEALWATVGVGGPSQVQQVCKRPSSCREMRSEVGNISKMKYSAA